MTFEEWLHSVDKNLSLEGAVRSELQPYDYRKAYEQGKLAIEASDEAIQNTLDYIHEVSNSGQILW